MKKILSIILAILMIATSVPLAFAAGDTVILYTNDIHCNVDDYAVLAAYRAELISQGNNVITVDAGDAFAESNGSGMLKGGPVAEIMNAVGYDYAVPGESEFGYGVEYFFNLAENEAEFIYTSSNFYYLPGVRPVLKPYCIKDVSGMKIAFIGISTPESVAMLPGDCFRDENNNYIYGFPTWDMEQGDLSGVVQESVDDAIAEGAEIVVAIGHLGIEGVTEGWRSTDVIAETTGIDYFIDAHSHEIIESKAYANKDGENVVFTSAGEDFSYFGQITLNADGSVAFELVDPDTVDIDSLGESAKSEYKRIANLVEKASVDELIAEIEQKLSDENVTDECKADFEEIKAQYEKSEADAAEFAEFKKIFEEYKTVLEKGIADGTLVKVDGTVIFEHYNKWYENAVKEYGEEKVDEIIAAMTDEKSTESMGIFEEALALTGSAAENADKIAELKARMDALNNALVLCIEGVHSYEYKTETQPLCGISGSETANCTVCGDKFSKGIDALSHKDNDGDLKCDHGCGYEFPNPADDCDHLCHKSGFVGLLWKIVRFFTKLFKSNPVCECGAVHY